MFDAWPPSRPQHDFEMSRLCLGPANALLRAIIPLREDIMRIGVPKEIKNHEYRVGMTPAAVRELTSRGHEVFVETMAGDGIGLGDETYTRVGAKILKTADEAFATADMIVKVKEPQPIEIKRLRAAQPLSTSLPLAPDPEQPRGLIEPGAVCIAYEPAPAARGGLPLLAP